MGSASDVLQLDKTDYSSQMGKLVPRTEGGPQCLKWANESPSLLILLHGCLKVNIGFMQDLTLLTQLVPPPPTPQCVTHYLALAAATYSTASMASNVDAYPTVVLDHDRLQQVSRPYPVPVPGLEADRAVCRPQGGSRGPHGRVQTVDGDVLRGLGAEEVEEVHLDAPDSHLQLWGAQNTPV